jgi:hypothetical protein
MERKLHLLMKIPSHQRMGCFLIYRGHVLYDIPRNSMDTILQNMIQIIFDFGQPHCILARVPLFRQI